MNLKTKLEGKEGQWIRIHFPDTTFLTGRLQHVGSDFIQIECYGRDDANPQDQSSYTQHLIPTGLIKMITIEYIFPLPIAINSVKSIKPINKIEQIHNRLKLY